MPTGLAGDIWKRRRVALLLSRQPMRPCGRSAWVRRAVEAVRWAQQSESVVVSSVGVSGWDLVTAIASDLKVPLLLYVISSEADWERKCRETTLEFALDPARTRFKPVGGERDVGDKHSLMRLRDDLVCEAADLVLPIAISGKGSMRDRLNVARSSGKNVDERFLCDRSEPAASIGYEVDPTRLTTEAANFRDDFLIHWTRACNGPWPDERKIDFWRAVISSKSYPRSGIETLRHILVSGRVIASSRHMRDGVATVGFSDLPPREAARLMRYRARYREMSFEPYGIGIRKRTGLARGIVPVTYLAAPRPTTAEIDLWRYQSAGRKSDWRDEREFRSSGDFDFGGIDSKDLTLFTRFRSEAEAISYGIGISAIPLYENPHQ